MRRSTDRILTTHGGNLPRPDGFNALLADPQGNSAAIQQRLPGDVQGVVDRQIACGVDIINDGEYVKAGAYTGYINARVTGWDTVAIDASKPRKRAGVGARDAADFPGFYHSGLWLSGSGGPIRPGFATPGASPEPKTERVCTGPVAYIGQTAIKADVDALRAGLVGKDNEGFIAALGPLSLGAAARNEHYADELTYMTAVADAIREEYRVIVESGMILQIDEPEFCTTWMFHPQWSVADLRRYLEASVELINYAIRGLPQDRIRFHTCWGSGHRPHVNDIEFRHFADLMLKINAEAYSFEASNVRHEHEWRIWEDLKLPDGKILVPGVIGHATDLVEHPELVAERLIRFAKLVGMENVQGGTDCGIGSRVGHEEVAWAKLQAMAEGAAIATKALTGR